MASVTFGGGITNIVGSHAGNTFSRNKGGSYMKKKPHGTNPGSLNQRKTRSLIAQVTQYYSFTLTDAERAAWAAFAATNHVINRLGNTTFLSAQQMFAKLNCPAFTNNGLIQNNPPASTAVGAPTSLTISADRTSGGQIFVELFATGLQVGDQVVCWLSPTLNPGKGYVSSELRLMPGMQLPNILVNMISYWVAQFGSFPTAAGQRLFARAGIQNQVTGIKSPMLQNSCLIT